MFFLSLDGKDIWWWSAKWIWMVYLLRYLLWEICALDMLMSWVLASILLEFHLFINITKQYFTVLKLVQWLVPDKTFHVSNDGQESWGFGGAQARGVAEWMILLPWNECVTSTCRRTLKPNETDISLFYFCQSCKRSVLGDAD